jgi:hypothetical protein
MLKGVFTTDQGDMLLLGLSRENVNRLTAGQPITITSEQLAALGIPLQRPIVIHFGETEQAIVDEVQSHGVPLELIDPEGSDPPGSRGPGRT